MSYDTAIGRLEQPTGNTSMSAPCASSLEQNLHLEEKAKTQRVYIGEGADGVVTKIMQGDETWARKEVCNEIANCVMVSMAC